MNRRRFMLLAVALVALNSFFWLAQGGFALPRAVITDLFGPRLIKAEVVVQTNGGTADYRIDRGVIAGLTSTTVTVREANGDLVPIDVAPDVRVQGSGRITSFLQLRKRLRVTVVRPANAPAQLIQVEGG